jgi:hypothetical protein
MGMATKLPRKSLMSNRIYAAMTLSILSNVVYRRVLRVIAEREWRIDDGKDN